MFFGARSLGPLRITESYENESYLSDMISRSSRAFQSLCS